MCETAKPTFARDRVKLGFSLSHTFSDAVGVGVAVKSRFGGVSRCPGRPAFGRSGLASVAPPTLLLYGAQSVYNSRCELTLWCTLSAHSFTPFGVVR